MEAINICLKVLTSNKKAVKRELLAQRGAQILKGERAEEFHFIISQ